MSLGLKQTLGDPWAEVAQRFAAGSVIEALCQRSKFGAFVQLSDGVEGMIHISEMSAEKALTSTRSGEGRAISEGAGARRRHRETAIAA